MGKAKKPIRRRNFRAARLRRKLRLRRSDIDNVSGFDVDFSQCDLPDQVSEHAAETPAGPPSLKAWEKAQIK